MAAGDNDPKLTVSATSRVQSLNMGLIPAGQEVEMVFPIELTNMLLPTGPIVVSTIEQPDWADVSVNYDELVLSSTPPTSPLIGWGDSSVVTYPGVPGPIPEATDQILMSDSFGPLLDSKGATAKLVMDLSTLTGGGIPWPAGKVYLPMPPPSPPAPSTLEVPSTGSSSCPDYDGMTSDVDKFPYARTGPAIVSGPIAGVLDLDTNTGRTYKLTVTVKTKVNVAYDREDPGAAVKSFELKFGSFATFKIGACFVAPDAERIDGEGPTDTPSYIVERVPVRGQ